MTKVSRKGFVDKNGNQVNIVPNVPGATAGNLASFDAEGNLQDSGKAIDQSPTANSANLVTSGGVKAALDDKMPASYIPDRVECVEDAGAVIISLFENPSRGMIARIYIQNKGAETLSAEINATNIANLVRALANPDSTPTADSDNLVTSGGVKAALDEVANNINALEYRDGSYESRIGVGQLNRDDDELDGASIYGKDAIRLGVNGNRVFIDGDNINNLHRVLQEPESPKLGGNALSTSGQIYAALYNKSDKEFCNKVYSRLMELEKESSVEYGITATYEYSDRPVLKVGAADIIYEYDRNSEKITRLYNVDDLYKLAFVGDVLVIKDLTTGTALGTAIVEELMSGPNRIRLSGLPLPYNTSYSGKSIGIAITHGSYSV